MLKHLCLSLLLIFLALNAQAEELPSLTGKTLRKRKPSSTNSVQDFGSRSIGHLVSQSGTLLRKDEVTAGTLVVGYGVSESWTVGTSPFVLLTYQAMNLESRWGWELNDHQRIILGFEYFKTFGGASDVENEWESFCKTWNANTYECNGSNHPRGFSTFKMEAYDLKLTLSHLFNPSYRLNITASVFNYIDDTRPFSLRMDPQNNDKFAANLTSLHEFRVQRNTYLNFEGGFWGMNYQYPYLHLGASVSLQNEQKTQLAGLGLSTTFSPSFPEEKAVLYKGYDSRSSIHPELQLQLFF